MNKSAQQIIGACIRHFRESRSQSLEKLAVDAKISYQYLSGVETGKENFSIQVLDSIAKSLGIPLNKLIAAAYSPVNPPVLDKKFFRSNIPLPNGLDLAHISSAFNNTQSIIHRINRYMQDEIGTPLQGIIQANNFSGLVSNILTNSFDSHTPYKHNHDQKYPDLIYKTDQDSIGLEVKTTINIGKGGESHNGHSGWHVIACYNFLENGDIKFVHIMFANLNGHQHKNPDWNYLGSKVNQVTGSRRTETYTTNLYGATKLRDGSVYCDTNIVDFSKWRQQREGDIPSWSLFNKA